MISRVILSTIALIFSLLPCVMTFANDAFKKPVRLKADGKVIDTGATIGHSSPCIEDIDGDGLNDLIVGDFSGKFHIYKNIGQRNTPVYKSIGNIKADGEDASVNIYCCVGGQPRFVDLNGDGIRDFISSSYDPGHCYNFRGLPDHKFAKREELIDKAGIPVRSNVQQKQNYESFGSFYTPVDWDADGDFDLLIGCFEGELKLRLNEGDSKKPVFATDNQSVKAGNKPLKVDAHCCPVVADWDKDGLWDILAGSDNGSVVWFRNVGTKTDPQFGEGQLLVSKHTGTGKDLECWSEDEIVPGIRAQIEVVDFNQDGKLDLILGDFCTAYDFRKDLTKQEKQQFEMLMTKSQSIVKSYSKKTESLSVEFKKKYPGDEIYSDKATAEWSKAYKTLRESSEAIQLEKHEIELTKQMRLYLASTESKRNRSYDLAIPHGYVWLFIRK